MISFLKCFGEVIVSSNLKPKAIVQGFFFAVRKKCREKYTVLKYSKREIEWRLFQLHSTFE